MEREKETDGDKKRKDDRSDDAEDGDDELEEPRDRRTAARKSLTLKAPAKKGVAVEIEEEEEEV